MMIALVLTIIALSVPGTTAGRSANEANILNVFNGNYDNLDQYQSDPTSFSYIQLRTIPVNSSALPGRVVIFNEWSYDGQVLNMQLCDVIADTKGVIQLVLYNFTDPSQYKAGEYNLEDVAKLTPADLHRPSTCESKFKPYGPGSFVGTWPDCRHYVKGKVDLYGVTMTCETVEVVIPRAGSEKSPDIPYNLVLKGDKFPVPGLPDDYVSPCQLKKQK